MSKGSGRAMVRPDTRRADPLEHCPDAVVWLDSDARVQHMNRAAQTLFGRDPGGSPPFVELMEGVDDILPGRLNVVGDRVRPFEATVHRNGEALQVRWTGGASDSGWVLFGQDVTAARRTEAQLRRSLRELEAKNQIAKAFLTLRDNAVYQESLDVVLDLLDARHGFFGYVDAAGDLVCPSLTPGVTDVPTDANGNTVFHQAIWSGLWSRAMREKRALIKNGNLVLPEGHMPMESALAAPILHGETLIGAITLADRPGGFGPREAELLTTVCAHVAPLLRARLEGEEEEQRRREAEDRFRAIFEQADQAILLLGTDGPERGRIIAANRAAADQHGYESAELIGMRITELDAPTEAARSEDRMRRIMAGEKLSGEMRHIRRDGSLFWVEFHASVVELRGQRYVLAFDRDISERKQLGEQLRQTRKMESVGRLAGGIAHDFNNLLTIIIGNSELLDMELDPDGDLRPVMDEVRQAAQRAQALTRQLLAFSRRQVLQPKDLCLDEVVRSLDKMLVRLIGEDVELLTDLAPDTGVVRVDPGQIEQVILNLVVNARDAMPLGGRLRIETCSMQLSEEGDPHHLTLAPGPYVALVVTDTGHGMDEETRAKAFEPFFTTKDTGQGTGLGLATVYGIVQQSNGSIWVGSTPGVGATFEVVLPRVATANISEAVAVTRQLGEMPEGTETVLVVEDDHAVRGLAARILQRQGYEVLCASDPLEALGVVDNQSHNIDLLLTDVVMPGGSGRQVAEALRDIRPDARVLFMSGYTDDAILKYNVLDGVTAFLQKPFTPADLAHKVREVLDAPPEV
jgi:PAS domain S-box-containing protein